MNYCLLSVSLWHKHNRIPSQDFIAWCRYHYNLPQLLQSDAPIIIDGTAYSPCLATKQCVDNNCYIKPPTHSSTSSPPFSTLQGARSTIRFMSCSMSHESEWSPDYFDFFENMTRDRLAKAHACKDTIIGDTPIKLAATFRQNSKDRLARMCHDCRPRQRIALSGASLA